MIDFIKCLDLNGILTVVISALIGGTVTHIFHKSKLKKEQKIRFENAVGDRIANSLIELRGLVSQANAIEIYNIEAVLKESGGRHDFVLFDNPIYRAIMQDQDTLFDFHANISSARSKYGNYLTRDVAAYLWYAERYFNQLLYFMGSNQTVHVSTYGTVFLKDIHDWQKSFDKVIVNTINIAPTKLEYHEGKEWELKKQKLDECLWNESVLKKVIDGEESENMNLVWAVLNGNN